jgi:hypothetical protein
MIELKELQDAVNASHVTLTIAEAAHNYSKAIAHEDGVQVYELKRVVDKAEQNLKEYKTEHNL